MKNIVAEIIKNRRFNLGFLTIKAVMKKAENHKNGKMKITSSFERIKYIQLFLQ